MIKLSFLCFISIFSSHILLASQRQEERRSRSPENFLNDLFQKQQRALSGPNNIENTSNSNTTPINPAIVFYTPPASPSTNIAHFPTPPTMARTRNLSEEWDDVEKTDIDRIRKKNGTSVLVLKNQPQKKLPSFLSSLARFCQTTQNIISAVLD